MAESWSAASIAPLIDGADEDPRFVPRALRPVRARGALAALVILFTAAVVATAVLPAFG